MTDEELLSLVEKASDFAEGLEEASIEEEDLVESRRRDYIIGYSCRNNNLRDSRCIPKEHCTEEILHIIVSYYKLIGKFKLYDMPDFYITGERIKEELQANWNDSRDLLENIPKHFLTKDLYEFAKENGHCDLISYFPFDKEVIDNYWNERYKKKCLVALKEIFGEDLSQEDLLSSAKNKIKELKEKLKPLEDEIQELQNKKKYAEAIQKEIEEIGGKIFSIERRS